MKQLTKNIKTVITNCYENNFMTEQILDSNGCPAGGYSRGIGFSIDWQNGPLGRGENRKEQNGAFVEHVIMAVIDRLKFYQGTKFESNQNEHALHHLNMALTHLNMRTREREERGVEGTLEV